MIKKQSTTLSYDDLNFSFPQSMTVARILVFIKKTLPKFAQNFRNSGLKLSNEDDISEKLLLFLNDKARKTQLLFLFSAKKGADFQIVVSPYSLDAKSIFLIEAKRLPPTSHKDYVQGNHGGIERFKREREGYGIHLSTCAMVGYIQDKDQSYWVKKVNKWIEELISSKTDIEWNNNDKLVSNKICANYHSRHERITKPPITIFHYWIKLKY